MLQVNVKPYASDALEDAMRLAQTKALNSYSWSDCLDYLNYVWMDMYEQLALVDEGYYSKTMRLTQKLTKLPLCVKNSIKVYAAQQPNTYNRELFRASGYNDLNGYSTYHISGFDLYCPDAIRRAVWLNYVPQQPQIFFTRDNRDPKLYLDKKEFPEKPNMLNQKYNLYTLKLTQHPSIVPSVPESFDIVHFEIDGFDRWVDIDLLFRNVTAGMPDLRINDIFGRACGHVTWTDNGSGIMTMTEIEPEWLMTSLICDFPYVFVSYKNRYTDEYYSGFYRGLPDNNEWIEYNPFAFTGRNSSVEYIRAKWNDKTGLGVIINDWNDTYVDEDDGLTKPRIKELGWTPDTLLVYPAPEMYRLLIARLADKFAQFNESTMMAVTKSLVEAEFAFKQFIGKDKSAWARIDNVNGANVNDWL